MVIFKSVQSVNLLYWHVTFLSYLELDVALEMPFLVKIIFYINIWIDHRSVAGFWILMGLIFI